MTVYCKFWRLSINSEIECSGQPIETDVSFIHIFYNFKCFCMNTYYHQRKFWIIGKKNFVYIYIYTVGRTFLREASLWLVVLWIVFPRNVLRVVCGGKKMKKTMRRKLGGRRSAVTWHLAFSVTPYERGIVYTYVCLCWSDLVIIANVTVTAATSLHELLCHLETSFNLTEE